MAMAFMSFRATTLTGFPIKEEGYNFWSWREHKVHYVVQGQGTPVVLVHGFGASVYHWRYNIPNLSKAHQVYALDLLGFGWSDKALIDYEPSLWSSQVADFIHQVVKRPAVLVGNSIGGLTALQTAAKFPELVIGLALLNPAGRFESRSKSSANKLGQENARWSRLRSFRDWAARELLLALFQQLNERSRIEATLNSVYKDRSNVDEFLIKSILSPASDPNAPEVFQRMLYRFLFQPSRLSLETLLAALSCPVLLLWGDFDPLAKPSKADQIQALYKATRLVRLQAGHCPHDEVPNLVNQELTSWISSLSRL